MVSQCYMLLYPRHFDGITKIRTPDKEFATELTSMQIAAYAPSPDQGTASTSRQLNAVYKPIII